MNYFNFNGELFGIVEPVLKINNRSFCYGDGMFESILWHKRRILFFDDHWNRLINGISALKLQSSGSFTQANIKEQVENLLKANKTTGNARIRIQVFRDEGGLYTPSVNSFSYIISITDLPGPVLALNAKGLCIDIFSDIPKQPSPLSKYKTANSMVFTMAGLFAKENGLDECFVLNSSGFIAEAISSNVFLFHENKLVTPPLSDGCIDGVMRKNIMILCQAENIPVSEKQVTVENLNDVDEIFITNATKGIQWVGKYRDKEYKNDFSKQLHGKLLLLVG